MDNESDRRVYGYSNECKEGPYMEPHKTREEAIRAGSLNTEEDYFWTCEGRQCRHEDFVSDAFDLDYVFEYMEEMAANEVCEASDGYLDLDADQMRALSETLESCLLDWLNKNIPQPKFYVIDSRDAVEHSIADAKGE